jgi:F420-dependent oxidoreductase-like protein
MKIGVIVPQGWRLEYEGWNGADAWARTRDVAGQAEALGFESIWVFDHFHTTPETRETITFESFTTLTALAAQTRRVRLGHVVLCAAFRNAALTAKMISTLDVISGGRAELGIGAGWKRDEWLAYGYGFPKSRERLAILKDHLEIIRAMMAPGRASYRGDHGHVEGAINEPKPLQRPRVPVMVGGNGPDVTWRLAASYADELNTDGPRPHEVKEMLPVIRSRCEEIDRDPATLPVSVHIWPERMAREGQERVDMVGAYRELGISRLIAVVDRSVDSDEALAWWAEDARSGGAELADSHALGA